MAKPPSSADGLDLTSPDEITQAEIDAFRDYYAASKGRSLPGLEFWFDFRPDVLKRYRLGVHETGTAAGRAHPLMRGMAWLQYYVVSRYEEGIAYQLSNVRSAGATKQMILDALAIAFLHSGPPGMGCVATSSSDFLLSYVDPEDQADRWPSHWAVDDTAFDSGMNFTDQDVSADDLKRLHAWYEATIGEIPGYVVFLAKHQPRFLKAYRNRFEHAIRGGLPMQMMPYLLLNHHVVHRYAPGIREAALLGRALAMTKDEVLDAVLWGFYFGGVEAFGLVEDAAGDILDSM